MSKMIKKIRGIVLMGICMLGMLGFSGTVYADNDGSIQMNYPIEGASFSLYQVGIYSSENTWELVDELAEVGVDLNSKDAANTLAAYVIDRQMEPVQTGVTDADGALTFEGLGHAAYLVIGEVKTVDHTTYTPSPVLLSLPQDDIGELDWNVEVDGKYSTRTFTELKVVKVWKDEENKDRPKSIDVKLYCDQEEVETVTLDSENNWTHEWTDLDADHEYKVVEVKVPENYKVSIAQTDGNVVLTNTYTPPTTPPNNPPKIPKTGQLWWPVGILVAAGLLLIMLGLLLRKDKKA